VILIWLPKVTRSGSVMPLVRNITVFSLQYAVAVATAIGLLVAIPAVAVFNYFQGLMTSALENAETLGHVLLTHMASHASGHRRLNHEVFRRFEEPDSTARKLPESARLMNRFPNEFSSSELEEFCILYDNIVRMAENTLNV